MSAFVCNPHHIGKLVRAYHSYAVGKADPNDIESEAAILANQNLLSVGYRYNRTASESAVDFTNKSRENYIAACIQAARRLGEWPDPVHILSMCSCYDYQACETDDYESTLAAEFINDLRSRAIRKLPGYDEAPWEYSPAA